MRHLKLQTGLILILLLFFLMVLSGSGCAPKEEDWPEGCPHGEVWLPNVEDPDTPGAYFDFSAGEIVYGEEGKARGDIFIEKTFISGNPKLGVALNDQSQFESILYDLSAPGWGDSGWRTPPDENTPGRIGLRDGKNIWIKTAEGHTAKIKILILESNENVTSYNRVKFEWIYQPDGSTYFVHPANEK